MDRYPPVLTKRDFVRRYALGEFGNASPTWDTLDEFMRARYHGYVHIRNRVAGGRTFYSIPATLVRGMCFRLERLPGGLRQFYFSAMAPTELTLFQGEVQRSINYLDLYYTTVAKPMRDALRQDAHSARGIIAVSLLRQFLCPNSYEWLQVLLDRYPDHVVEFSTYDCEWGTLPGFNTVFWEVRGGY